jgi:hypothetical protein
METIKREENPQKIEALDQRNSRAGSEKNPRKLKIEPTEKL